MGAGEIKVWFVSSCIGTIFGNTSDWVEEIGDFFDSWLGIEGRGPLFTLGGLESDGAFGRCVGVLGDGAGEGRWEEIAGEEGAEDTLEEDSWDDEDNAREESSSILLGGAELDLRRFVEERDFCGFCDFNFAVVEFSGNEGLEDWDPVLRLKGLEVGDNTCWMREIGGGCRGTGGGAEGVVGFFCDWKEPFGFVSFEVLFEPGPSLIKLVLDFNELELLELVFVKFELFELEDMEFEGVELEGVELGPIVFSFVEIVGLGVVEFEGVELGVVLAGLAEFEIDVFDFVELQIDVEFEFVWFDLFISFLIKLDRWKIAPESKISWSSKSC